LDEVEGEENKNKLEITKMENELKDVERRYGMMQEEIRLKELEAELANRKKKVKY
jgi:hypothetical protein